MFKPLLTPLLVLTLSAGSLPPCVGMDMAMGAMSEHGCCDGSADAGQHDATPRASMPPADCCGLAPSSDPRAPVERMTATAGQHPVDRVLSDRLAPVEPGHRLAGPQSTAPPGAPAVPPRLLYSVFLI